MGRSQGIWATGVLVAAMAWPMLGAHGSVGQDPGSTEQPSAGSAEDRAVDDDVRLNEIQVVGTHNSYKRMVSPAEQGILRSFIGAGADLMAYQHEPLPVQFSSQRVRQIELDVFVDSAGGLYDQPLLRTAASLGPLGGPMTEPGNKVFHIQDVDYASTCARLVDCLAQVKGWSDANPGHLPLAVLLELKDSTLEFGSLTFTTPEPWTTAAMDGLDADIRSVFDEEQVITPDDVRGDRATLEEAVLTDGWPTLGDSRGKVMFLMDNGGVYRDRYRVGRPSLEGRVLFTDSNPGQPDAAFVKYNDARQEELIAGYVAAGYVVRTRADGDTLEARAGDTSLRDSALRSGAQWVSTDYPVPGIAYGFQTDYVVGIPGGTVARCNPVNAPPACVSSELESLAVVPPPPPTTAPPATPTTVPATTAVPGTPTAPTDPPAVGPTGDRSVAPAAAARPRRARPDYTG